MHNIISGCGVSSYKIMEQIQSQVDRVLQESTRSGRGQSGQKQLDPEKLQYIKSIIAGRTGKNSTEPEFELVWDKCLTSIGKQCQILRNKEKKKLMASQ